MRALLSVALPRCQEHEEAVRDFIVDAMLESLALVLALKAVLCFSLHQSTQQGGTAAEQAGLRQVVANVAFVTVGPLPKRYNATVLHVAAGEGNLKRLATLMALTKMLPSDGKLWPAGTSSAPSAYLVSGAGAARFNGEYRRDGSFRRSPRYKHVSAEPPLYIRQGGAASGGFGIAEGKETCPGAWPYFCEDSRNQHGLQTVPSDGWKCHEGLGAKNPAPTVAPNDSGDERIKVLLNHLTDGLGHTVLFKAAMAGRGEIVKYLQSLGADPRATELSRPRLDVMCWSHRNALKVEFASSTVKYGRQHCNWDCPPWTGEGVCPEDSAIVALPAAACPRLHLVFSSSHPNRFPNASPIEPACPFAQLLSVRRVSAPAVHPHLGPPLPSRRSRRAAGASSSRSCANLRPRTSSRTRASGKTTTWGRARSTSSRAPVLALRSAAGRTASSASQRRSRGVASTWESWSGAARTPSG